MLLYFKKLATECLFALKQLKHSAARLKTN